MFNVIEFTGGPMPLRHIESFEFVEDANDFVNQLKEQDANRVFYVYSYSDQPKEEEND